MKPLRVLIADDMALARRRLRRHLGGDSDIEIAGECADGLQTVQAIRELRPDLVLLDVQMPELDGFGVIEAVGVARMPLVIFVTAHDEFALRAFEVHAVDYLLKPFDTRRLRESVERAKESLRRAATGELEARLAALLADTKKRRCYLKRIAVRFTGRTLFVPTRDIDYLEAVGNYVRLHVGREAYLIRERIAELEAKLEPATFARIHRSTIVNVARVVEMHPLSGGDQRLVLRGGATVVVSRTHREELMEILERS